MPSFTFLLKEPGPLTREQGRHYEHQALRAERMRFLDGAQVVVSPVPGSEEAAAAQAGHGQAMRRLMDFHSFLQTHLRDLIAPGEMPRMPCRAQPSIA